MLKFGIVTNINPALAQARVQFAEDDILSYWLPILQQKTLKDKFYAIPDIGEHVACHLLGLRRSAKTAATTWVANAESGSWSTHSTLCEQMR